MKGTEERGAPSAKRGAGGGQQTDSEGQRGKRRAGGSHQDEDEPDTVDPWRSRRLLLLCGLAVLLSVLVYLNTLTNPFVFDDKYHLVDKQILRDLNNLWGILGKDRFRPVVNLMYAVEYALWGLAPPGFHLVNLVLHAANVALLFLVTRRLLGDLRARAADAGEGSGQLRQLEPLVAFFVAALLAVHPMMSETVGYVSSRPEVLAATLFLLGLLAMRRGLVTGTGATAEAPRPVNWSWIGLGLVPLVVGLGTKEHVAMLPFVVLAYDRLVLGAEAPGARWRLRRLHLPLAGLVLALAAARVVALVWLEYADLPRPIWHNLMMQLAILWRYLFLLVLPVGQSVVHEVQDISSWFDPVAFAAGVGLLALLVLTYLGRRRLPLVALGTAWFFLLLAPSSSIVPLLEPMSEHRVYLASCGFFLAVGAGSWHLLSRLAVRRTLPRPVIYAVLLLVLAPLGAATVLRNRVWADPVTLWQDAVRKAPGVCAPRYALGDAYRQQGNCEAAVKAYRKALSIQSDVIDVYINLGICLARLGQTRESERVFENVIKMEPDNPQALNNLAKLALEHKQPPRARKLVLELLKRDPCNDRATRHLILLDQMQLSTEVGQEQARVDFNWLISHCPKNVRALNFLGLLYFREKLWNEANGYFEKVEQAERDNLFALIKRAWLNEYPFKNPGEALRLYRRVRRISPRIKGLDQTIRRLEKKLQN